ncbi:HGxxPAAW family protein [Arthrobacter sp. L77]|uniref:HGxxPAAW family protein n=1 Tax=Arthrobacter sp. L77 TaxID=1496689 RepID=UPI0005B804D3
MASETSASATRNTPATHAQMGDETIGHGNSPAAWTCVLIMLVGAAIASFAYILASTEGNHDFGTLLFWGGIGVMFVGLIVGFIMRKIGYGVGGSKLKDNGH